MIISLDIKIGHRYVVKIDHVFKLQPPAVNRLLNSTCSSFTKIKLDLICKTRDFNAIKKKLDELMKQNHPDNNPDIEWAYFIESITYKGEVRL